MMANFCCSRQTLLNEFQFKKLFFWNISKIKGGREKVRKVRGQNGKKFVES